MLQTRKTILLGDGVHQHTLEGKDWYIIKGYKIWAESQEQAEQLYEQIKKF